MVLGIPARKVVIDGEIIVGRITASYFLWTSCKTLATHAAAKTPATRTERRYRAFLNRQRKFTVLDPACGSGNFFYFALRRSKDLEHRVQFEAEALSFQRGASVIKCW